MHLTEFDTWDVITTSGEPQNEADELPFVPNKNRLNPKSAHDDD